MEAAPNTIQCGKCKAVIPRIKAEEHRCLLTIRDRPSSEGILPAHPVRRGLAVLKGIAISVLVIVGVVLLAFVIAVPPKQEPSKPCDMAAVAEVMAKMQSLGIVYKIDRSGSSPDVYVKEPWYQMPIDGKENLDLFIRCELTGQRGGGGYVHYVDYKTGKSVAISSRSGGLSMK